MPPTTDTKERLLAAAADLFWRQGYAATGVSQILKEADAKSGSLYYFFPTKGDLLLGVLDRYRERLLPEVVDPVFAQVDDPIDRVFGILDGYRQALLMTDCRGGCPIGNLALELADHHPEVRTRVAENFAGWCAVMERCLNDAADRLPADVDTATLAHFILTVMEGAIMQARTERSVRPYETAIAHLRDYIDRLIADR